MFIYVMPIVYRTFVIWNPPLKHPTPAISETADASKPSPSSSSTTAHIGNSSSSSSSRNISQVPASSAIATPQSPPASLLPLVTPIDQPIDTAVTEHAAYDNSSSTSSSGGSHHNYDPSIPVFLQGCDDKPHTLGIPFQEFPQVPPLALSLISIVYTCRIYITCDNIHRS